MYLDTLDGKVTITKKKFLCCTEILSLHLYCTKDSITLFRLPNKNNIFFTIPSSNILSIHKRQIDKNDLHTFSIFYTNTKNNVEELKLKAMNRSEMNNFVISMNKMYKQKEYKPIVGKSYESIESIINPFYSKKKKEIYFSFALIEYIMLTKYMISFMNRMKEKYKKMNSHIKIQRHNKKNSMFNSSFSSAHSSSNLNSH